LRWEYGRIAAISAHAIRAGSISAGAACRLNKIGETAAFQKADWVPREGAAASVIPAA
jgi:hypothetical protein